MLRFAHHAVFIFIMYDIIYKHQVALVIVCLLSRVYGKK